MKLQIEPADGPPFQRTVEAESLIVGRASSSDLALADPFLSRHHARIFRQGTLVMIEDLGSRNGTELNGHPVLQPTALQLGDVVRVSGSVISICGDQEAVTVDAPSDFGATILKPASELLREADTESEPESIDEVEDLRNFATRLKLINELHQTFSQSMELEELLELVLDRSFELLDAEQGVLFLRDSEGEYARAIQKSRTDEDDIPLSRALIEEVCDKGMAALVMDTATDERFASAQSIIMSGMRSLIAAPLFDPNGSLGMVVLCSKAAVHEFDEEDMQFLVSLASIAALKIRNASLAKETARRKKLEEDLALARQVQESLLPAKLPRFDGYELYAQNLPSRGVSGDYYSISERLGADECVLLVADVAGKGMPAAMLTSTIEALSAGPIEEGDATDEICEALARRLLHRSLPQQYATAFLAVLEVANGKLAYTNAGHNPALLTHTDGSIERLHSSGMPLGLVSGATYTSQHTELLAGDTLIIYTDGITEAEDTKEEEFGLERLEQVVAANCSLDPESLAQAINEDLEKFVDGVTPADDRTLVLARRLP